MFVLINIVTHAEKLADAFKLITSILKVKPLCVPRTDNDNDMTIGLFAMQGLRPILQTYKHYSIVVTYYE